MSSPDLQDKFKDVFINTQKHVAFSYKIQGMHKKSLDMFSEVLKQEKKIYGENNKNKEIAKTIKYIGDVYMANKEY